MEPNQRLPDASSHGRDIGSQVSDQARRQSCPSAIAQKTSDILAACELVNVSRLRVLAETEGGFVTDTLRQLAWPILLGLPSPAADDRNHNGNSSEINKNTARNDWTDLERHKDEEQVQLDVNRSFIYYPEAQSSMERNTRKHELSCLITEVLRRYPYLNYFQGYHDICQVILLVMQPSLRFHCVARLSVLRLRDFMLPTLDSTTAQLRLLPDVLFNADPELCRHIGSIEPFYALAGTLTMYAHNIERYCDIARLFDIILAYEPVFSIYLFAQIIIDRRDEVLEIDEPDILQVTLSKVPPAMNLDILISKSVVLFDRFPPNTLRSWRLISTASALKTARDVDEYTKQTMEDGHRYFVQQANELHWAGILDKVKMLVWNYRRPLRTVGMAIAIGAISIYMRRNPTMLRLLLSLFSK